MLDWALDGVLAAQVDRVIVVAPPAATGAISGIVGARPDAVDAGQVVALA